MEQNGAEEFDNDRLTAFIDQCPRAAEYDVAIQNVFENYTVDVAEGMVRYGVHNGFDVWRRFFHHHVPMAEDLQQIFIQELYVLKPVTEADAYKLS